MTVKYKERVKERITWLNKDELLHVAHVIFGDESIRKSWSKDKQMEAIDKHMQKLTEKQAKAIYDYIPVRFGYLRGQVLEILDITPYQLKKRENEITVVGTVTLNNTPKQIEAKVYSYKDVEKMVADIKKSETVVEPS